MHYINNLEKCIEFNKKILEDYLKNPYKEENYTNLLKLSCSIEDIYEDKFKNFELCDNEIKNINKLAIKELKQHYLDDFNKKYNGHIRDDYYVGFRNTGLLELNRLDEVKFKELCSIDFHKIQELELKFENNIDIDVLMKANYINISFLGLIGKINDINILSKLPFKNLTTLFLSDNDFSNTNFDIFRNI